METKTKVLFRFGGGEVTAMFPALAGTRDPSTCTCYAHLGQHGSASLDYIRRTRPATRAEYRPLAAELRRIGYRLAIGSRATRKDYAQRIAQLER